MGHPERRVRQALIQHVRQTHERTPLLASEMKICFGGTRIDLTAVGASLDGYEIKTASDRLDRLPRQIELYDRVVDYATLVVDTRHVEAAASIVPIWWGIIEVGIIDRHVMFAHRRRPSMNPRVDSRSVAGLLFKWELKGLLRRLAIDDGTSRMRVEELVERLAENSDLDTIRSSVRSCLTSRPGWPRPV